MSTDKITDDLCRICDGRVECAPTALLLISLVHTLYGHIGPEPDYFGRNKNAILEHYTLEAPKQNSDDQEFREHDYEAHHLEHHKTIIAHAGPYSWNNEKEEEKKKRHIKLPYLEYGQYYDFIIVGGGTAGCVLASRLSENRKWKILMIEAGPEEPKIALIPGLTSEFRASTIDWQYSMRPKKGFCQNRDEKGCEVVQGRVLGGTSTINDMAYTRGSPADYDEWALDGNDGWNFANVLPYFKYSEGNYDQDVSKNTYSHSVHGPLDIGRYPYIDVNVDVLLSAFSELGYNYTDVNGRNQLGFMRTQTMSYFGERVSSYTAFIEPIKKLRNNVEIITESLVVKLLFENENEKLLASGVEFIKRGQIFRAYAKKEVIVSAGTINTPKILMMSGIGPRDYLEYLGITNYYDLPVGSNFHDHVSVCLPVLKLTKTSTVTRFTEKLKDITTYYTKGMGPLATNFQVIAFLETSLSDVIGAPDIEARFRGHDSNMYYDKIDMCISLLTPKSRGQVMLNASNPIFGDPLIYPNFLNHHTDEKKIIEGILEIVKLFDTEVFKTAGIEFDPRPILINECQHYESATEGFWSCIIRYFSAPLHNYVGTCKMGPTKDAEAVVDNHLRVYGVSGLRVVDASIIPKITRGSTAAVVIMIAEKASNLIKTFWYYLSLLFTNVLLILSSIVIKAFVFLPVFNYHLRSFLRNHHCRSEDTSPNVCGHNGRVNYS